MLPLPALPMIRKGLRLRLRDAWKHAHLDNHLAGVGVSLRFDRTVFTCGISTISFQVVSSNRTLSDHVSSGIGACCSLPSNKRCRVCKHLLSTVRAEKTIHRIPAPSFHVHILLQRPLPVLDIHLLLLNDQVTRHERACHFTTVGTVAEVTAWLGEELAVGDGHVDAAAETVCGNGFGEGGNVMLFRVAGVRRHLAKVFWRYMCVFS